MVAKSGVFGPRRGRSNSGLPRKGSKSDSPLISVRRFGSRSSAVESSSKAFGPFAAKLQ